MTQTRVGWRTAVAALLLGAPASLPAQSLEPQALSAVSRLLASEMEDGLPPVPGRFADTARCCVEEFPAYNELRVTSDDALWVRMFRRPGVSEESWVVFQCGLHGGQIDLPARSSLLDAGADFALVLKLDELDVATVQLYRLIR